MTITYLFYRADLKHYRLRTDSHTPKMEFIADYVMKGRILVLPIQGKGIANITMCKYLFELSFISVYKSFRHHRPPMDNVLLNFDCLNA